MVCKIISGNHLVYRPTDIPTDQTIYPLLFEGGHKNYGYANLFRKLVFFFSFFFHFNTRLKIVLKISMKHFFNNNDNYNKSMKYQPLSQASLAKHFPHCSLLFLHSSLGKLRKVGSSTSILKIDLNISVFPEQSILFAENAKFILLVVSIWSDNEQNYKHALY